MMRTTLGVAALLLVSVVCTTRSASAQPASIPVEGILTETSGAAINLANASFTFTLYDAATGGSALHTEAGTLDVIGGRFRWLLGTGAPLDLGLFADEDVWLEVRVGATSVYEPRIRMATVAHAVWAGGADEVRWEDIRNIPPDVSGGGGYTSGPGVRVDTTALTMGLDSTGCPAGGAWVRTPTGWACQNPSSSATPGTGILIASGGEVSVDAAAVQRRLQAHDCPFGIRTIGAAGNVTCAVDNNTDTNVWGRTCTGANEVLRGFDASGQPLCVVDQDTNVFGQACPNAGDVLQGFTAAGVPICFTPSFVDTNVWGRQCPVAGQVVRSYDALGNPQCVADRDTDSNVFGRGCAAGQLLRGFDASGNPQCVADRDTNTLYGAGAGIRLSGSIFSSSTRTLIRSSCAWHTCGNGGDCPCGNDLFLVGWQDRNSEDRTYCCQMWIPN